MRADTWSVGLSLAATWTGVPTQKSGQLWEQKGERYFSLEDTNKLGTVPDSLNYSLHLQVTTFFSKKYSIFLYISKQTQSIQNNLQI